MISSKPITVAEYYAVQGSSFTDGDAQIIGPQLRRLFSEGKTGNAEIVKDARPPETPLHKYFEWDDTLAAERFREHQAAKMIRSIEIKVIPAQSESLEGDRVRAFHSIKTGPTASTRERAWMNLQEVIDTPDIAGQVIEEAKHELLKWSVRYNKYRSLFPSFEDSFRPVLDFTDNLSQPGGIV